MDYTSTRTIYPLTDTFLTFHRANPDVYRSLVEQARLVRDNGRKNLGIALLYERIRWMSLVREIEVVADAVYDGGVAGEEVKLPAACPSFYARAIMLAEPPLLGLFALRTAEEADYWIDQYRDSNCLPRNYDPYKKLSREPCPLDLRPHITDVVVSVTP